MLHISTWNILNHEPTFLERLPQIIDTINAQNLDVVALQEIPAKYTTQVRQAAQTIGKQLFIQQHPAYGRTHLTGILVPDGRPAYATSGSEDIWHGLPLTSSRP